MSRKEKIITKEQAMARMASTCSRKECCPYDIYQKLYKMNFSGDVAREIVDQLKSEGYISEERFVRFFINDKLRFNKWSKKRIMLSLRQKDLPQQVIEDVFSEYPESLFYQSLHALMEKKWRSIQGKSNYKKKDKLINYALRRGFHIDVISYCVREMN